MNVYELELQRRTKLQSTCNWSLIWQLLKWPSFNSPLTDHLSTKNWVSRPDSPLLEQAITQLSPLLLIKDSKADGARISMEQIGLPIISKPKDRRTFDLFNNHIKCLLWGWCPGSPKRLIGMVVLVLVVVLDTNLRFCGTGQEILFGFVLTPFQGTKCPRYHTVVGKASMFKGLSLNQTLLKWVRAFNKLVPPGQQVKLVFLVFSPLIASVFWFVCVVSVIILGFTKHNTKHPTFRH